MSLHGQAIPNFVPASRAVPARILVGTAAILKSAMLVGAARDVFTPGSINLPWFSWTPIPSVSFMLLLLGVWASAALAFVGGWHARIAGSLLSACIAIAMFSDRHLYSNHLHLLLLLVILLTFAQPRARDKREGTHGNGSESLAQHWPLVLIGVQISVVYFYAAVTKVNETWLSGVALASSILATSIGKLAVSVLGQPGIIALSVTTIVLELWLAFALWTKSRVRAAVAMGILFHFGIVIMMRPRTDLVVFTLLMIAGYTVFLPIAEWKPRPAGTPMPIHP